MQCVFLFSFLQKGTGKKHKGFADFFPLHTEEFKKRVPVITMQEFIEREGGESGRVPLPANNATRKAIIQKAATHCDNRKKSELPCVKCVCVCA